MLEIYCAEVLPSPLLALDPAKVPDCVADAPEVAPPEPVDAGLDPVVEILGVGVAY